MSNPKIGDEIYVPTALYLGHGVDDFEGGLCTISSTYVGVSAGEETLFVEVYERPGIRYNWPILAIRQDELRKEYGERRGHAAPDYDPAFNLG